MAFLVEHVDLSKAKSSDNVVLSAQSTAAVKQPKSGPMKLFRRTSSNVSSQDATTWSKRDSVTESERKSSFSSFPTRLRRRKTKTHVDTLGDEPGDKNRLGELFLSLPSEILTQIICYLSLTEIYSIRRTTREFSLILDNNSSVISRCLLSEVLPRQAWLNAQLLYPMPSASYNMNHLLRMLHRQKRIDRVIYQTLSYLRVGGHLVGAQTFGPPAEVSTRRQRLEQALQVPAWTAYHFFESYRDIIIAEHDEVHQNGSGRFWDCQACESKAKALVESYPLQHVLPVYQFLQLLMMHYHVATRLPTQTGPLGRQWKGKKSNSEDLSVFTLFGGIEEMSKISIMQGSHPRRMEIINKFVTKVRTAADINQANAKSMPGSANNITAPTSSQPSSEDCHQNTRLRQKKVPDVTGSLCPSYSKLTPDHIDRLPTLQDFLLPIWRDRVERENLHANHPEDLETPLSWVYRTVTQQNDLDDQPTSDPIGDSHHQTENNHNHNPQQQQQQAQNPNQTQNQVTTTQHSSSLFTSYIPSNFVPNFGAPPV